MTRFEASEKVGVVGFHSSDHMAQRSTSDVVFTVGISFREIILSTLAVESFDNRMQAGAHFINNAMSC